MVSRTFLDRQANAMFKEGRPYTGLALVLGLVILLLPVSTITQAAPESGLSTKELKQLVPAVEAPEKSVFNIRIESEIWVDRKVSLSDPCEPWQRTPIYVASTAWFDGSPGGKARVDVHKQVIEWLQGAAPYAESSYSISFDGKHGRVVNHTIGHSGKTVPRKRARIMPRPPKRLTSGWYPTFTGVRFSMNFFFVGRDLKFSQIFNEASQPDSAAASWFGFTREPFAGVQCIRITSKRTKAHGREESYWLDPGRGFALLGSERKSVLPDDTEQVKSRIRVKKLKEIVPGIWWPIEATLETLSTVPEKPYERIVYRALSVAANDPDLDEAIFKAPIPPGYLVDDEVAGTEYIVRQE
jgi:hypothetical protein